MLIDTEVVVERETEVVIVRREVGAETAAMIDVEMAAGKGNTVSNDIRGINVGVAVARIIRTGREGIATEMIGISLEIVKKLKIVIVVVVPIKNSVVEA